MRHAAAPGLPHLPDLLERERRPEKGRAQRLRFQDRAARHKVENRHIGTVTVRDEYPAEAVVGDTLCDIEDEIEQMLDLDVDGAREIHVMRFVAERNDRHQENVAFRLLRRGFADAPDQKVVDIQGQMRAMVLDGSDRQHHDGLALRHLAQFRPGVVLVQIVFARHDDPVRG